MSPSALLLQRFLLFLVLLLLLLLLLRDLFLLLNLLGELDLLQSGHEFLDLDWVLFDLVLLLDFLII
jgi:hypothetical protein